MHIGHNLVGELEVSNASDVDPIPNKATKQVILDEKKQGYARSLIFKSMADTAPTHSPAQILAKKLSQGTLNTRGDEIISAAKLAYSQANAGIPPNYSDDEISRHIIKDALDRAGIMVKAVAAETGSSTTAMEPPTGTTEAPILLSTKEVLEVANGVLKKSGNPHRSSVPAYFNGPVGQDGTSSPNRCLSPAVSDVGSIDDYEKAVERLPTRLEESEKMPRAKILQRIDGIVTSPVISPVSSPKHPNGGFPLTPDDSQPWDQDKCALAGSSVSDKEVKAVTDESIKAVGSLIPRAVKDNENVNFSLVDQMKQQQEETSSFNAFSILNYFWGTQKEANKTDEQDKQRGVPPHTGSSGMTVPTQKELPTLSTSLVKVMSDPLPPSFAEAVQAKQVDPRMPLWIKNQFTAQHPLPQDGSYHLGASRTVIVHEIQRGNWTWCTAWSPDGKQLAVATENHHLAVIDTKSSSVWRVRHDKRIQGPVKNGTTHSIRSIAWGTQFIAIGGTGNAVSILAPTPPYPVLHIIKNTGFVGSLHWLIDKNTLVIGSRLGKALIVQIWGKDDSDRRQGDLPPHTTVGSHRDIQSTIVHTIDRQKAWVNAVKWSPTGTALAVGDGKGFLCVYGYTNTSNAPVALTNLANFMLEDSIMDVEWSADGQWLYAGGEDFTVTVINTTWWEAVHRIKRDRWVQFISASKGGSHVAVGGVSSNVSLLEVDKGWDIALNVSLKGLVPLSASWHPQDQYLVLTGQNNSILAVETTNARYVTGHYLRSVSPILDIEFSPDGRMAAIGNEAGIVTIFRLSGTTFISAYELVLDCKGSLSMHWCLSGAFLYIVSGDKLVVIGQVRTETQQCGTSPPNKSGFFVARVVRDLGTIHAVALHPQSCLIAVCGTSSRILDASANFTCVKEFKLTGMTLAAAWSPDGNWLATIGKNQNFMVYDTSSSTVNNWEGVFTVKTDFAGLALSWGPSNVNCLQYCAYGGEGKQIYIMEIRTKERTWENVLTVPREGIIHQLDWNNGGLMAAAIGNGTVTIMDLSYLQSGFAVNEMSYNWQRQALTCFTEIRRNRGKNCMRTVRWIPSAPGSDCLLAVGGTDGDVEILDLTERERCSGFSNIGPSS
jgi:WD40 repeat protein